MHTWAGLQPLHSHVAAPLLATPHAVQGGWETDEELREAAMRETVEEAGVRGELEVRLIDKAGAELPGGACWGRRAVSVLAVEALLSCCLQSTHFAADSI